MGGLIKMCAVIAHFGVHDTVFSGIFQLFRCYCCARDLNAQWEVLIFT